MMRRFGTYGLLGWCAEVAFTTVGEYAKTRDPRLSGHTSLWMFPIYGLMAPLYEPLHDALRDRAPAPARAAVYAAGFFAFEYGTGRLLRELVGDAPWDYSHAPLHLHGLIRADYLPVWAAAGLAMEHVHDRLDAGELA